MKYTKTLLEQHVSSSTSFNDLARRLGVKPIGSNTTNLSVRCRQFEIDTSHFTGQSHQKGRPARNRQTPEEILVLGSPEDIRESNVRLRRALIETGMEYSCTECGNTGEWNGKPLNLQNDHINGKYWDNRRENLRFICPNCHTQTETWGRS